MFSRPQMPLFNLVWISMCVGLITQTIFIVQVSNENSSLARHMGDISNENTSLKHQLRSVQTENISLTRNIRDIKAEIRTRNKAVETLCKVYDLETRVFWYDWRELIPRSTACVVNKGELEESLVIIHFQPETFQL